MLELLAWISERRRTCGETMEAWRATCLGRVVLERKP